MARRGDEAAAGGEEGGKAAAGGEEGGEVVTGGVAGAAKGGDGGNGAAAATGAKRQREQDDAGRNDAAVKAARQDELEGTVESEPTDRVVCCKCRVSVKRMCPHVSHIKYAGASSPQGPRNTNHAGDARARGAALKLYSKAVWP